MRRKSILFVMDTMVCGGIETSGLAFLSALPPERFDITLLLVQKTGVLLERIPAWVKVREVPLSPDDRREMLIGRRAALRESLGRGNLLRVCRSLVRRVYCNICVREPLWRCVEFDAMLDRCFSDDAIYDCAIAYSDALQCVAIVSERIRAKMKLAWFHTEYPPAFVEQKHYGCYYKKFDHLFACSEALAAKLNDSLTGLPSPVSFFPYILEPRSYAEKARCGTGFTDHFQGLRLLSVGRLCEQKGFDLAVLVHARLRREGYAIRWYVIGEGYDKDRLHKLIQSQGVQDSFILLGLQTNPFPFFAACDVYVQPSRYEGYCLTVAEARAFAKPIVCTDFAGAREQIADGLTGLIVSCEVDALYQAVKRLLDHSELGRIFSQNLSCQNADTTDAVHSLIDLIEVAGSP